MSRWPQLLTGSCDCPACGRRHVLALRSLTVAEDWLEQLPGIVRGVVPSARVLLVADARTHRVAGQAAANALHAAGVTVETCLIPDPAPGADPVCDDRTKDALRARLPAADVFLAVGSGVVNDLTKWLAWELGKPYLVVATAASMNGYASDNIAPTVNGLKCLFKARGPVAVLSSLTLLRSAPPALTSAGLGDVLAKPVSAADWRLGALLFGDFYCQFCVDLVREVEPLYTAAPERVREAAPEALGGLFEALVLSGLAMSMAGTSSPASGGEHLVSHTLDMLAGLDGTRHDLHGRQVGLGTILAAALYQELMAVDPPIFRMPADSFAPALWGRLAPEVATQNALKRRKLEQAMGVLTGDAARWTQVRATLQPMLRSPQEIKACLRRAGAAHTLSEIGVSRERFLRAFLHAHEIRERFTVLDLAWLAGILPARAEALVDTWVAG